MKTKNENAHKPTLAVLGGSGKLGYQLARRWGAKGYPIVVGSRNTNNTRSLRERLIAETHNQNINISSNLEATKIAEIIIVAVPFKGVAQLLEEIKPACKGKTVIDCTVGLTPPKVFKVQFPDGESAGMKAQKLLGEKVNLVSAFQNIGAAKLDGDTVIEPHVLICGNCETSVEQAIILAKDAGMQAFHAGPIENSLATEALTSLLIFLNKKYGAKEAGIAVTGLR
ncbi:MAG: NADPH-dependent F420 reductase [Aestuariibacter sp.]